MTFFKKHLLSDRKIIEQSYKTRFGKKPNLENPQTFNEKLQWLKLYWRKSLMTRCADKRSVREYVSEEGLNDILIEAYGVYERAENIDISSLPKRFVLKASHGSGWNIICKDKNTMDWEAELDKIRKWLKDNYYYYGREWVYKKIKPCIVCEKYLEGENGQPPDDYKIFCFNGRPRIIQVDTNRFINHKRNMYDVKWNLLDFKLFYPNDEKSIQKPENLNQMLEIAEKLAK